MAKRKPGSKSKSGNKKHGRGKRKAAARGSALSLFVRGKISADQYWQNAQIKTPKFRG